MCELIRVIGGSTVYHLVVGTTAYFSFGSFGTIAADGTQGLINRVTSVET